MGPRSGWLQERELGVFVKTLPVGCTFTTHRPQSGHRTFPRSITGFAWAGLAYIPTDRKGHRVNPKCGKRSHFIHGGTATHEKVDSHCQEAPFSPLLSSHLISSHSFIHSLTEHTHMECFLGPPLRNSLIARAGVGCTESRVGVRSRVEKKTNIGNCVWKRWGRQSCCSHKMPLPRLSQTLPICEPHGCSRPCADTSLAGLEVSPVQ